ncbi:MAG: MBL fold metallo-hydrolase [Anaerolineae bacterium]|nr:MBL fold metallo-hydrolase [Anaerolineae bacterium]MCI0609930.1 MBL fold metallo-hydrolase [Anaerolineae bacterium]
MAPTRVVTLDLNFQGRLHAIASYLIRTADSAVLIESGPGSTLPALEAGLAKEGLSSRHVTHVLLTHIHLDHAGAAGWLAQQGAKIYVHPVGAPHMLNPEKLLASAARIYGDRMQSLWGEFLPVPESQLKVPNDAEAIVIGNLEFIPINTPGHAEHHYAYLFEDICFSGDVGGVRIPGYQYLRVPMPPPELHLERWHESIARLRKEKFTRIAPTHFGIYNDPEWQLREVEKGLDSAARWLEQTMSEDSSIEIEALRQSFTEWMMEEGVQMGLSEDVMDAYTLANPPGMSADGLLRYWRKVKNAG